MQRGVPFTTSLHTRFPDYLAERLPVPERWTCDVTWGWLRRFPCAGAAVLAATPTLGAELTSARLQEREAVAARRRCECCSVRAACARARSAAADLPDRRAGGGGEESRGVSQARSARHQAGGRRRAGARAARRRPIPTRCSSASRDGEALAEIYAAADVFVFPSRTDTFGLVLLEALASGVPVGGFPGRRAARRDRRQRRWACSTRICGAPAWKRWNARARTAAISRSA